MKKYFSTSVLIFLISTSYSQHTLLSNEMLSFGSVMTLKSISNLSVIDTTIRGNGVVWNFNSLTNNTSVNDLIVNIVPPSSTPYSASFPNASYAYKDVKGATTNYRYFDLTSNKMERVGSYTSNINVYNDPQVEYVFPLTLGTTNNDSWNSTNSSFGGTYDLECIGSGTLNTPGGSFNALMVKVHLVESFLDFNAYYWYSADNGSVLLSYIDGDGFFIPSSGLYLDDLSVGVEENKFITEITYNNPVEHNLKIGFESNTNYKYAVINSTGKMIYQGASAINTESKETLNIDFSHFPAGLYFVKFTTEDEVNSTKTIKIIKN